MGYELSYRQMIPFGLCNDENGGIWFYNYRCGAIVRVELLSGDKKIKWLADSEHFNSVNQYGESAIWKDKLIFAPRHADSILIFDIKTKEIDYIGIDNGQCISEKQHNKFIGVCIYENYAYFFPGRYRKIVKLNLTDYHISYIDMGLKKGKEYLDDNRVVFASSRKYKNHYIYLTGWQKGILAIFDMKDDTLNMSFEDEEPFGDVCVDKDGILLTSSTKPCVMLKDTVSDEKTIVVNEKAYASGNIGGYRYVLPGSGRRILISDIGNYIWGFDPKNRTFDTICTLDTTDESYMKWNGKPLCNSYTAKDLSDDMGVMFDAHKGDLLCFDYKNNNVKRLSLLLDEDDWSLLQIKHELITAKVINEEKLMELDKFLKVI